MAGAQESRSRQRLAGALPLLRGIRLLTSPCVVSRELGSSKVLGGMLSPSHFPNDALHIFPGVLMRQLRRVAIASGRMPCEANLWEAGVWTVVGSGANYGEAQVGVDTETGPGTALWDVQARCPLELPIEL